MKLSFNGVKYVPPIKVDVTETLSQNEFLTENIVEEAKPRKERKKYTRKETPKLVLHGEVFTFRKRLRCINLALQDDVAVIHDGMNTATFTKQEVMDRLFDALDFFLYQRKTARRRL